MANRYWVGGTAAWDGTAGTKWAATSGGLGGETEPTAADDVFFDSASGVVTVTVTGTRVAKSINCTGFTGTLAGATTPALNLSGSLTLATGMTVTYAGTTTFLATASINTAGKTIGPVDINGSAITVNLLSSLTSSGAVTLTLGIFNTNNYTITATQLSSNNNNVRTLNLTSSLIVLSATDTPVSLGGSNFTFLKGSSEISLTGTSVTFTSVSVELHNLTFASTTASGHRFGTGASFAGNFSLTVNNLKIVAPTAVGVTSLNFGNSGTFSGFAFSLTIKGKLESSGTGPRNRILILAIAYCMPVSVWASSVSVSDTDFRDIIITGPAYGFTGTRLGDLGNNEGITFPAPKNVYWNSAAGGNWSDANVWALSAGGAVSNNNFPLAQDTAYFVNTGLNTSATVTMDAAIAYTGGINCSGRTNAMTLGQSAGWTICGDYILSSSVSRPNYALIAFAATGRNITVNTAGITMPGPGYFDLGTGVATFAGAYNSGGFGDSFRHNSGTLILNGYSMTWSVPRFDATKKPKRLICGASQITMTSSVFGDVGGAFLVDTGTSNFIFSFNNNASANFNSTNIATFYSVTLNNNFTLQGNYTFNGPVYVNGGSNLSGNNVFNGQLILNNNNATNSSNTLSGSNTISSLLIKSPGSEGIFWAYFGGNQTISGAFNCDGASERRRVSIESNTRGLQRTITANSLSASYVNFRDIRIAGSAFNTAPINAGDIGNNSGIVFPAAKTVYWNLAGTQNWTANAWATGSGGSPALANFPLPQDTAIFDNTGAAGTVTMLTVYAGTIDMSSRTSAMTFTTSTNNPGVAGNLKLGSGVTFSSTAGNLYFVGAATQTITSNGVTIGCNVIIENVIGEVTIADALVLNSARTLTLSTGNFNAATFNVTAGFFNSNNSNVRKLKMGSGTWTLSGTGIVWNATTATNFSLLRETANIVLSDTSTAARTFNGGGLSYPKLTIGGTTGISTLTISGNNQFAELASTKTVAHTIALGTTVQSFGKWTVTGTVGNVVTLTGTSTTNVILGSATSGIDYLAMGSIGFASTSPGEFYAGANSTGTAGAPVYRTATPAATTRYWVGGTGNWSDTARWSTGSGGLGGASVPTSLDNVVFDSLSNATAYTATINADSRCNSLTVAGPASGNLTLAGASTLMIHGNVTLPATGLTRTFTSPIILSGSTTGKTFTTNGVTLASNITVNGVGCEWTLGSSLTNGAGNTLSIVNGTFDFATYNYTNGPFNTDSIHQRTVKLGTGTLTWSTITFGTTPVTADTLTVTPGTSTIVQTSNSPTFSGNGKTFYALSFSSTTAGTITINGSTTVLTNPIGNTFTNLTIPAPATSVYMIVSLASDQTVTGTLTFSAGANATRRRLVRSNTPLTTTRTLTIAAISGATDIDFQDITVSGAVAPLTGTRLGDCKNNRGIIFTAPSTKYWNLAGGGSWTSTAWATSSGGGAVSLDNFPLPQDSVVFEATGLNSGATVTIDQSWFFTSINMSARTANTMTLATGTTSPTIFGNWINGTGTTLSGTGSLVFSGRTTQTITPNGRTFTQPFNLNSLAGTLVLAGNFVASNSLTVTNGQFDAVIYNVTVTAFASSNSNVRAINMGTGLWTLSGTGTVWDTGTTTNLTLSKNTANILLSDTSATGRTLAPGGVSLNKLTIGGATGSSTLTLSGVIVLTELASTKTVAHTITCPNFGQGVVLVDTWTASGSAGNILSINGYASNVTGYGQDWPFTVFFGASGVVANVNYLNFYIASGLNRGAAGTTTAYAGVNSLAFCGSSFWKYQNLNRYSITASDSAQVSDSIVGAFPAITGSVSETVQGSDSISSVLSTTYSNSVSDSAGTSETVSSIQGFGRTVSDTVTITDSVIGTPGFKSSIVEEIRAKDSISSSLPVSGIITETSSITDAIQALLIYPGTLIETARASDSALSFATFVSNVQENFQGSDSISAISYVPIIESNISESAQQSDNVTATLTLSGAFQDTVQGLDQISATLVYLGQISELGRGNDSISAAATFTGNLSDSAQGSDQIATSAVMLSSVQDTIQGADTFAGTASFVSQVSDSARGADSFATSFNVNSSVSEQTRVSDIASALAVFASSIQESVRGSDAANATAIFVRNVSDSSRTSDQFAARAVWLSVVQDSVRGSDAVFGTATFASQASDSVRGGDLFNSSFTANAALSDAAQGSDSLSALAVFRSSLADTARAAETFNTRATFNSSFLDLTRISDSARSSAVFSGSFVDTVRGSDQDVGFIRFPASLSETARISDVNSARFTAKSVVSESVRGSESISTTVSFKSNIADTTRASETFNTRATFNSSFLDLTRISDVSRASAGFLSNVADSVRGSDSDVGYIRFPATVTDTVRISDTNSARFIARGVISESVRASDSLNTIVSFKANVADQVRAFEAITTKAVFNSATNNQVRIADTNVGFIRFPTSISDTAQIFDTTSAKATFKPLVSETVRGSDAVSTVFTVRGRVNETVRAADTTRVAPSVFNAPFVDTVRIADTDRALAVFPTAFADSAQMSDLNIAKMIYSRTTTDTAQVSDFTAAFRTSFPVFSDTVRGSDALTAKVTLQSSLSELARVSDVDSSLPIYSTNIVDTVRTAETVAAKQTFKTDINETGRIEPIVYSYPIYRTNIAEQSQGSDTVSSLRILPGSITETARISDSVSAVEILYPVIQESARGSETVSTLGVFVSVASDSASAQDTMTVAASIFNAALSESVTGADSQVGFITFPTSVAESAQGSDTDVGFIVFPASISEGATGIDQFSAILTLNPQVSESVQVSDLFVVAPSIFNAAVLENTLAQDIVRSSLTAYASITESVRGSDVVSARFLWEVIDDTQTPNWAAIGTTQTAGWVQVNDTQSAGWVEVNSTQTASWSGVDSTQNGNWVKIDTI